jgi:hypothetical protein
MKDRLWIIDAIGASTVLAIVVATGCFIYTEETRPKSAPPLSTVPLKSLPPANGPFYVFPSPSVHSVEWTTESLVVRFVP